ncbi:hypothetical protein B14911_28000 [Bacillus sp. NRRL B-14911]|nr:hypothetical protein B14911_28000 [Bacillus sp. NRRL B-14911]
MYLGKRGFQPDALESSFYLIGKHN